VIWEIKISKRTLKGIERMPAPAVDAFWRLLTLLKADGPTGPKEWKNYGKLKGRDSKYHCHLSNNHQWVACWRAEKGEVIVEILYVGSHQGAPY
jgi:hypothetical protein